MEKRMHVTALLMAAGRGRRMGYDKPKQFLLLGGMTIFERTLRTLYESADIDDIIAVVSQGSLEESEKLCLPYADKIAGIVEGGKERQDSVMEALGYLRQKKMDAYSLIVIHDAARPYVSKTLIGKTIEAAERSGAATAVVYPKDTIRMKSGPTLTRKDLYAVQTPQAFRASILMKAYDEAYKENRYGTDDAGLVERIGVEVTPVKGEDGNIKITTPEDIRLEQRVGTGFDVHRLTEGRRLILGGLEVPHERGLEGHSDADVATHALIDAILGAAGYGDIGVLYPDTDSAYKDISSLILLEDAWGRVRRMGFSLVNCDLTIMCQAPKLAPYIAGMKENISKSLGTDEDRINIKATTTEKLGFVGRGEGIAAEAVCMLSLAVY